MKPIKVLVVDDSIMFQKLIAQGLHADPQIQVVAMAKNPYEARDMILRFSPDVMTLDVEMPKMNGIEFVKKLMPQYPLPIVMVSSLNDAVFDAMEAGAVDFVHKPLKETSGNLSDWVKEELIPKVKVAAGVKVAKRKVVTPRKVASTGREYRDKILAIGASTGGTEAIYEVVRNFNTDIPGTVIVQHMPPGFTDMYAKRLDRECKVQVKEAQNGDLVERGKVLIAPGDKQMKLTRTGGCYRVEVFEGEKVSGHCPSVDVLFQSVARAAASNAIGVLLTGMGSDGARGLLAMRKAGSYTIGQDEASSIVYGMPKVAFDIGAVAQQASLEMIAGKIYTVLNSMP